MTEQPKACPFCGSEATFGWRGVNSGANVIECNNDGCPCRPFTNALSHSEAIAAWNTRAAPEADAWQPIETAPKDGSSILAVWLWRGEDGRLGGQETHEVIHWCGWWDNSGFTRPTPTHWMPLPAPPALASTPAQEGE